MLLKQFFFFLLSFVHLLFDPVEIGSQGFNFFGFLIFSFLTLAPANFAIPHFLCLCNKINDYAAIGLLFFNLFNFDI